MNIKNFRKIVLGLTISLLLTACNTGDYTLWQLDSMTKVQMNSYVVHTPENKIIVVDGGYSQDAEYLKGFIASLGNHVDLWIISHPHSDHVSALSEILVKPDGLSIDKIVGSIPSVEWALENENAEAKSIKKFKEALKFSDKDCVELSIGDQFEIDGISIEILSIKNPELTMNPFNNSSMVFKMNTPKTSLLFLGDLGLEGGEKLLKSENASKLQSDYVQMAHHGQSGVSEEFYKKVNPSYCLWATPDWLWENNIGQGVNSGPWQTLEVRKWMEQFNIKKHYVMKDGLQKIQLK